MSVLEELTDEQLAEGLARANEQLQAFLSRQMASGTSRPLADSMARSGNTAGLIQSTVKLQNTVRKIEAEIRSREGEPGGLTARFEMKMSPEQKQWVMAHGGAAKIRELIDRDRQ
jgi:hypothetical protein